MAISGEWDDVSWSRVPAGAGAFRLGISADTRGTRDDTVKFVGVHGAFTIRLDGRFASRSTWIGTSRAMAAMLGGGSCSRRIRIRRVRSSLRDWLKVEYVGVPPGTNARMVIGLRGGQERTLHNEGWPETNRAGRTIGLQHLVIVFRDQIVQVRENDQLVYDSKQRVADFNSAFLYLQMSSIAITPDGLSTSVTSV